ncbi:MAG TPA: hypothetical protein VGQ42_08655 [Candidatus Dormibacteraeota bacterium]|nr:hypothetical protein [Candidatus Dormibacteraeota bacterium]
MSDLVRIPLSVLPHDEGFLRRRCPRCDGEFKVEDGDRDDDATDVDSEESGREYFCPLCHSSAEGFWLTPAQEEYIQEAVQAATAHMLEQALQDGLGRGQGGGLVTFDLQPSEIDEPIPPDEPHDMMLIGVPCHPVRLKVPEDWTGDVACHICGVRYPLDVVHVKEDLQ